MDKNSLKDIAHKMVADGKGILAADESTGTIKKRFDTIALVSTEDSRRDYREMLFRSDEAMQSAISGVILYDETIRQKAADGTTLVSLIEQAGSIPGIKVDTGAKDMAGHPNEKVTEGLDGLRERLEEYFELGARFAKWRAVINIGDGIPSRGCISANTHALARYAALCQENGIVPIVEPEVIMDGSHTAETCYEVTSSVLTALYAQLDEQNVYLEGSILKPNMIVSGTECPTQASVQQVAEMTLDCFNKCVPQDVPGIIFLSGGQADELATAHLDAINKMGPHSWKISFSYGRALQAAPLKTWSGKPENVSAAKAAFTHRASMNKLASLGEWNASLEKG
ncbi:MAG: class I fructose-bisphosphate aldolase [Candidatus Micropelagos sp.]|jgi:fructose-bisphosphate aldolase class I|uniref:Fructose-bisphosphate aldolase n=1 Tax=PS1 clade bacterium TaxID=2175152 RepID=A0A368EJ34_9PROT|nr:fructose-bisphosphate aldolase class I [Hyphomicrobiales bacterium]OUV48851.1 MAG: fructose-bisphosphate aldolase [Alphaproteobacteria bacterium TMED110]RCL84460.1 MAG: fructose-bisphosphate aldolase class I [PS1 clade bacterium]